MLLRLDKMLAHLGYGSRKDVKRIIRKGEVLVNGEVIPNTLIEIYNSKDELVFSGKTDENGKVVTAKKYAGSGVLKLHHVPGTGHRCPADCRGKRHLYGLSSMEFGQRKPKRSEHAKRAYSVHSEGELPRRMAKPIQWIPHRAQHLFRVCGDF